MASLNCQRKPSSTNGGMWSQLEKIADEAAAETEVGAVGAVGAKTVTVSLLVIAMRT